MTLFVPLDAEAELPSNPPFLHESTDSEAHLSQVLSAILKARRIIVVCGAGISVQAGLPDFRSTDGLFATLKKDNPKEAISSGRDLFDASVFNSEHMTTLFCRMVAELSQAAKVAQPTPFHHLLAALDRSGKLMRCYTQNIDAIEQAAGLSFGVPEFHAKPRSKGKSTANPSTPTRASSSRLPTPPAETPRCIPLHGTLQTMYCNACTHTVMLEDHIASLANGMPQCPSCEELEAARAVNGKRPRGIGKLRPSVVLYNEAHKDGEGVGDAVSKDLLGTSKGKGRSGADLLLVVGTSLRVPGTKRIVREFSKAVKSRVAVPTGLQTPSSTPRKNPSFDEDAPIKSVYLNLDFPVGSREWEGCFDVWVQGDAQTFAVLLQEALDKRNNTKEAAAQRKRQREEETEASASRSAKRHKAVHRPLTPVSSQRRRSESTLKSTTIKQTFKTNKRQFTTVATKTTNIRTPLGNALGVQPSLSPGKMSPGKIRIPARPQAPTLKRQRSIVEVVIDTLPPGRTVSRMGTPSASSNASLVSSGTAAASITRRRSVRLITSSEAESLPLRMEKSAVGYASATCDSDDTMSTLTDQSDEEADVGDSDLSELDSEDDYDCMKAIPSVAKPPGRTLRARAADGRAIAA